jgi:integrase
MHIETRQRVDGSGRVVKSYIARVYHPGLKKKVNSPTFDRKADADEWGKTTERKIKLGESIERAQDITVDDLAKMYLASLNLERTRLKRKGGVDRWVRYFGKNRIVSHIRRSEIKAFAASLKDEGLKASSAATYTASLKAAFSLALDDELLTSNPAVGQLDRKAKSAPKKAPAKKALTHGEHDSLLAKIPERHRAMFDVWPRCGLRIGEMRALRWVNVDLAGRELHVVEQYQGGTGFCEPKCGSAGTVTLGKTAVHALREWKLKSARMKNPLGLVFPADGGGVLDDDYLTTKVLKKAAIAAGLEWVTPHSLRHTFGSWLLEGGVTNLTYIQTQLRHASLKQTIQTYLHDTSENPHDLADMVDGSGDVHKADTRKATGTHNA